MLKIDNHISLVEATGYKTEFWKECTSKIQVGESVKLDINAKEASIARVTLDAVVKKLKLTHKYKFVQYEGGYRVWRTK
jgi:hypothetical protein